MFTDWKQIHVDDTIDDSQLPADGFQFRYAFIYQYQFTEADLDSYFQDVVATIRLAIVGADDAQRFEVEVKTTYQIVYQLMDYLGNVILSDYVWEWVLSSDEITSDFSG